jgi:hypothetical protein
MDLERAVWGKFLNVEFNNPPPPITTRNTVSSLGILTQGTSTPLYKDIKTDVKFEVSTAIRMW